MRLPFTLSSMTSINSWRIQCSGVLLFRLYTNDTIWLLLATDSHSYDDALPVRKCTLAVDMVLTNA